MLFVVFFGKMNYDRYTKCVWKGLTNMKPSSLRPIILRLEAMVEDKTGDTQVRRFEVDGEERAMVTFHGDRNVFTVLDYSIDEELEFDNIDFVAMEVYELIQPVLPEED